MSPEDAPNTSISMKFNVKQEKIIPSTSSKVQTTNKPKSINEVGTVSQAAIVDEGEGTKFTEINPTLKKMADEMVLEVKKIVYRSVIQATESSDLREQQIKLFGYFSGSIGLQAANVIEKIAKDQKKMELIEPRTETSVSNDEKSDQQKHKYVRPLASSSFEESVASSSVASSLQNDSLINSTLSITDRSSDVSMNTKKLSTPICTNEKKMNTRKRQTSSNDQRPIAKRTRKNDQK